MSGVWVLRVKPGCAFAVIAPGGFRILAALDNATKVLSCDLTIAAGTNDHTTGRHPLGEAYDVSVKDLALQTILKLKTYLDQALGARFTVLYEVNAPPTEPELAAIAFVNPAATGKHFHIQVKKGTTYPPLERTAYGV